MRFRKGLAAHITTGNVPRNLTSASQERQRSMLVVNSIALVALLKQVNFKHPGGGLALATFSGPRLNMWPHREPHRRPSREPSGGRALRYGR